VDSAELRAVQQPLKDAYREDPQQAVITLRAQGQLDEQAIACSVDTGRALAVAGLHPATGGDGSLACSGDMLLQALVACAGVTLRAVATSLQVDVAGGTVSAEGDLTSAARWRSARTRRSGSAPSAWPSTWTPTPALSSSRR
jgi:hypothetical protein